MGDPKKVDGGSKETSGCFKRVINQLKTLNKSINNDSVIMDTVFIWLTYCLMSINGGPRQPERGWGSESQKNKNKTTTTTTTTATTKRMTVIKV